MKRFVVAYVEFYNHVLTQEIVEAETEQDARWMHSETNADSGWDPDRSVTDSMDASQFQAWCFNSDFLVSVREI